MLYLITIVVGSFNEAFVKGRIVVRLDRSGGCALCIIIGPARLELIRAAIKQRKGKCPSDKCLIPLQSNTVSRSCASLRGTHKPNKDDSNET